MRPQTKKGLTYIEILAGIAIIGFIIFGMNAIFGIGIENSRKAKNLYVALCHAQELMEKEIAKDYDGIKSSEEVDVVVFSDKKLITVTVSGPDIADVELNCTIADPTLPAPEQ